MLPSQAARNDSCPSKHQALGPALNCLLVCCLALVTIALNAGCGGGSSAPPPTPPPAQNPVPSITSLSPSASTAGAQAQTLAIQGTNFLASSTVTYNGQAHTVTFVSSTQMTISLSASDQSTAGNYPVVVTNPSPGGGQSSASNFTVNNPQPSMNSLSPSVITAGSSDMLITIVGTSFVAQSTVNLNGSPVPTVFSSSTQLSATISATSLTSSGIRKMSVTNPTPGGGESASLNLVVTEPLPAGISGPLILSIPPSAALAGKPLQYQVIASSANPSALVFSLSAGPAGMSVNGTSGLLQWTPVSNQVGDQQVTVVAQDSAGQTSQSFTLSVFGSRSVASSRISASAGGAITVADASSKINGLSISFPAGALSADTTITVSELSSPPTLGGTPRFLLKGFSIDPDGTQLSSAAQVTIPYSPSEFATTQGITLEDFLGVYFVDPLTGGLQFQGTFTADKVNHALTGTISHFSVWEVTSIARLCPPHLSENEDPENCPNSYEIPSNLALPPVVLIHGFQVGLPGSGPANTYGDEGTWGRLRFLLANFDSPDGRTPISAWRFDWDSAYTPFEISAVNLSAALQCIENHSPQQGCQVTGASSSSLNLVAHSFGGILVRTYLEDRANRSYPPEPETQVRFADDINRVMTLGTPHSGIGGSLSTGFADGCSLLTKISKWNSITCFEATGGGEFMDGVNGVNKIPLPPLKSPFNPQYDLIAGRRMSCVLLNCALQSDDGLITTAGNQLCGTLPGGGGSLTVCSRVSVVEEINPRNIVMPGGAGLCHSTALLSSTCNPFSIGNIYFNIAIAAIDSDTHPLWNKVCNFLGSCGATSPITVSVSPPSVTLAPGGTQQFTATVTGTTNTAVTWTTSGNCGTVSISGLFTAGNVTATCQGQVKATSQADTTKLALASVTVNTSAVPPTIITQPSSQTVLVGQTATFTVVAGGTAPLSYQWQTNDADIPGAASASYTTPPTTTADTGSSFTVVVSNIAGSLTSVPATLTVNAPPPPGQAPHCVYVANFGLASSGNSITGYAVNSSGALSLTGTFAAGDSTSFGPRSLSSDPSGRFLYVAYFQSPGAIFGYNIQPNCTLNAISGSPFQVAVFGGSGTVLVDPTGKYAYVLNTLAGGGGLVYAINPTTGALSEVSSFVTGQLPVWMTISPTAPVAYVANMQSNNVSAYGINSTTGGLTPVIGSPFAAETFPVSVALDRTGSFAYVPNIFPLSANSLSSNISGYNVDAGGVLVPITGSPFGAGIFLIPFQEVPNNSTTPLAVHPTLPFVYVAANSVNSTSPGYVFVFSRDSSTGALQPAAVGPFPVGTDPSAIVMDPTGTYAYVTNFTSSSISAFSIDPATGSLTPIPNSATQTGPGPVAVITTQNPAP